MENTWEYGLGTLVLVGSGSLNILADKIQKNGMKKGLLVIDPALFNLGFHNRVVAALEEKQIELEIFHDVKPNPHLSSIENATALFKTTHCSFVIGLGGGSAIDSAKSVGILAGNPGPLPLYEGKDKYTIPPCPIYAVPTTAGTGSEVSCSAVFYNDSTGHKISVRSPFNAPKIALLDSEFLTSLPPKIIASSGIDAFSHALESYVSKSANPLTEVHSLAGITGVIQNLEKFYSNPKDAAAAQGMQIASLNAGIAFGMARVGIDHALSHPLEDLFKMPHGQACACALPAVMRFAHSGRTAKYADVAKIFLRVQGKNTEADMSEEELSILSCELVEQFINKLGLPTKLSRYYNGQITERDIETIVEGALHTGNHLNSPVVPNSDDLRKIVEEIL